MANLKKNQIITVTVCGYSSSGQGVAKYDGFVIFISGAISGEICEIRLLKVLKNMAYAKIEKLLVPSEERCLPVCQNYPKCGGCNFLHMSYKEELRVKKENVQTALKKIAGIELEQIQITGGDNLYGYRNKAQYFVDKSGNVGFYRARSHDLCPTERCHIQNERADACAHALKDWLVESKIKPYDEQTGQGLIRGLLVRTGQRGTHATVISNSNSLPEEQLLINKMRKACPELCGLTLNTNSVRSNVILGEKNSTIWGSQVLRDELCGLEFDISPNSFYQVNRSQAEKLYWKAVEYAHPEGKTLLDLYCGIGTISLLMARFAKRVIGAEIVPAAIANACENASLNSLNNVNFICADAGTAAVKLAGRGELPDIVIVDPPRKGLSVDVINAIMTMAPERMVYISCNPATLARDLKLILQSGSYTVDKVEAFDMFPRCAHVETICLLSKLDAKQHIDTMR